jgi:hypothetical protein
MNSDPAIDSSAMPALIASTPAAAYRWWVNPAAVSDIA